MEHQDDPYPTDEEINERAYELCFDGFDVSDGDDGDSADQPDGLDSCLGRAEHELLDRAAKRALLPSRPRRGR